MDIEKVKTIGYLLTTYADDLNYFATFIRFSKGEISLEKIRKNRLIDKWLWVRGGKK